MSYQEQYREGSSKRTCSICEDNGFPGQEIIKLSTYGGRDTNVLNLDGSRHYHLFSMKRWEFEHYYDNTEISKWDEHAKRKS